mgnify:CR=1 FL=1
MFTFRRVKNIGLFLLLLVQMVVTALALLQIEDRERTLDQLGDEIVGRFEILARVDRSVAAAANLFFYDSNEDFISPASLNDVCRQATVLSGELVKLNANSPQVDRLNDLASIFPKLEMAIRLYTEAESIFSTDREILSQMVRDQLAEVLSSLMSLRRDAELTALPANANLLRTLEELGHVLDDLFSQFEGTAVHQPESIVHILEDASADLDTLEELNLTYGRDDQAHALKLLRDDIRLLKLNLLGIYKIWDYDPNLSYLGDEIIKLARAWDRIQYQLGNIIDAENERFSQLRVEVLAEAQQARLSFSLLAAWVLVSEIGLAVLLSRVLQRRLMTLAQGMQAYAEGDGDARVEVPEHDDLTHLSAAFNEMATQLQRKDEELNQTIENLVDSQAELQEAHTTLELRVVERTRELQLANDQLLLMGKVFDHAKEGILVFDSDGRAVKVNPEFCRMTGFEVEQVLGKRPEMFRPEAHTGYGREIREALRRAGSWEGELILNDPYGRTIPTLTSISQYSYENGSLAGHIAVYHDIRELKEQEEMIRYQAYHDALTGLPNRLLLTDRLEVALSQARRHEQTVGLLFLDLDDFKKVNDSFGHAFGDRLLMHVADILRGIFRSEDTVSRIGGDEFVIVLGGVLDRARIHMLAERVLQQISASHNILGREVRIGVSIGMASYPDNGSTVDDLLKNADIAMYSAKDHGKNVIHAFTQSMDEETQKRLELESALWRALEQGQFELYLQPQLSTDGSQLCGAECLVRWNHPERGLVSPFEFIPLWEETGLILPLGRWVLEAACRQTAAFANSAPLDNFRVYVNVSPKQFADKNFYSILQSVIDETGLDPACLGVEITESSMVTDIEYARELLEKLNELGISIAIDDFGTGYSSLLQLKNFPIQTLKIDRSFVMDLPGDRSDEKIVETIIGMAQQLEIDTVAEGVETAAQQELLQRLGCRKAQGFLFGRPMPMAEFEIFMQQWLVSAEDQRSNLSTA